ncbi:MAG: hypothetical protein R2774_04840 [Saprospiraceae bacterium]
MQKCKNAKFRLFYFFILSLFLSSCADEISKTQDSASTNVSSRSGLLGDSCFEEEVGQCDVLAYNFINVEVDGYDCLLNITVEACVEVSEFATVVTVGDYHITNLSNCPDILIPLSDLILNEETPKGEINQFISDIDNLIFPVLDSLLYLRFGKNNDCYTSAGTFTTEYIRTSCKSICLYELIQDDPRGPTGDEGGARSTPISGFIKSPCDSDGCCIRSTTICFNTETNQIDFNTTVTLQGGGPAKVCDGGSPDIPDIPVGYKIVACSPCIATCE